MAAGRAARDKKIAAFKGRVRTRVARRVGDVSPILWRCFITAAIEANRARKTRAPRLRAQPARKRVSRFVNKTGGSNREPLRRRTLVFLRRFGYLSHSGYSQSIDFFITFVPFVIGSALFIHIFIIFARHLCYVTAFITCDSVTSK